MESPATFAPTQCLKCNIKRQACVLTCKICLSVCVGGVNGRMRIYLCSMIL